MSPEELAEIERAEAMRERAGLDARGPGVNADTELMEFLRDRYPVTLDAIEAEAVAAERVRLAEAVRALPRLAWVHDGMDGLTGTQPEGRYLDRSAVLALLEDKAEPSKAEPSHVHDQRFDGDDPYLVCACGARWDALTGRALNTEAKP